MHRCPFCNSTAVTRVDTTVRGDRSLTAFTCTACGKRWSEVRHGDDPDTQVITPTPIKSSIPRMSPGPAKRREG